jgi:hypothetical protein
MAETINLVCLTKCECARGIGQHCKPTIWMENRMWLLNISAVTCKFKVNEIDDRLHRVQRKPGSLEAI